MMPAPPSQKRSPTQELLQHREEGRSENGASELKSPTMKPSAGPSMNLNGENEEKVVEENTQRGSHNRRSSTTSMDRIASMRERLRAGQISQEEFEVLEQMEKNKQRVLAEKKRERERSGSDTASQSTAVPPPALSLSIDASIRSTVPDFASSKHQSHSSHGNGTNFSSPPSRPIAINPHARQSPTTHAHVSPDARTGLRPQSPRARSGKLLNPSRSRNHSAPPDQLGAEVLRLGQLSGNRSPLSANGDGGFARKNSAPAVQQYNASSRQSPILGAAGAAAGAAAAAMAGLSPSSQPKTASFDSSGSSPSSPSFLSSQMEGGANGSFYPNAIPAHHRSVSKRLLWLSYACQCGEAQLEHNPSCRGGKEVQMIQRLLHAWCCSENGKDSYRDGRKNGSASPVEPESPKTPTTPHTAQYGHSNPNASGGSAPSVRPDLIRSQSLKGSDSLSPGARKPELLRTQSFNVGGSGSCHHSSSPMSGSLSPGSGVQVPVSPRRLSEDGSCGGGAKSRENSFSGSGGSSGHALNGQGAHGSSGEKPISKATMRWKQALGQIITNNAMASGRDLNCPKSPKVAAMMQHLGDLPGGVPSLARTGPRLGMELYVNRVNGPPFFFGPTGMEKVPHAELLKGRVINSELVQITVMIPLFTGEYLRSSRCLREIKTAARCAVAVLPIVMSGTSNTRSLPHGVDPKACIYKTKGISEGKDSSDSSSSSSSSNGDDSASRAGASENGAFQAWAASEKEQVPMWAHELWAALKRLDGGGPAFGQGGGSTEPCSPMYLSSPRFGATGSDGASVINAGTNEEETGGRSRRVSMVAEGSESGSESDSGSDRDSGSQYSEDEEEDGEEARFEGRARQLSTCSNSSSHSAGPPMSMGETSRDRLQEQEAGRPMSAAGGGSRSRKGIHSQLTIETGNSGGTSYQHKLLQTKHMLMGGSVGGGGDQPPSNLSPHSPHVPVPAEWSHGMHSCPTTPLPNGHSPHFAANSTPGSGPGQGPGSGGGRLNHQSLNQFAALSASPRVRRLSSGSMASSTMSNVSNSSDGGNSPRVNSPPGSPHVFGSASTGPCDPVLAAASAAVSAASAAGVVSSSLALLFLPTRARSMGRAECVLANARRCFAEHTSHPSFFSERF